MNYRSGMIWTRELSIVESADGKTWPVRQFARAVIKHWRVFVTSSVIAGTLWLLQGIGYFLPHWVYWLVASIGLLVAFYRAWLDEHQSVARFKADVGRLATELVSFKGKEKQELVQVVTVLRALLDKVRYWRNIAGGKWGMMPPAEKLLPNSWSTVIYEADKIRPELRSEAEVIEGKVREAEALITEFLSQPPAYKQVQLMNRTYVLLDEAAPHVSNVLAEFEAFEKGLR